MQVRKKVFMKNKKLIIGVALACAVAGTAAVVGANSSSAAGTRSAGAGELVLNTVNSTDSCVLSGGIYCLNWKDTLGVPPTNHPDMPVCGTGGFWAGTYDGNVNWILADSNFLLEHWGGFDIYTYWGGFTSGSNGDSLNYGASCPGVEVPDNSTGWICNQWGVMAGGGIKDTVAPNYVNVKKGFPYLISFGSGQEIKLKGNADFVPVGVWICNHPWPYWGNICGDGFARPLDSIGDYFLLKIYSDADECPIVDTLFWRYSKTKVTNPKNWHYVDLTKLDNVTQTLYFVLESTDTGQYGMNTAAYFCMDKLTVNTNIDRKSVAVEKKAAKQPKKLVNEFGDFLTVSTHVAGEAVLYNAKGQVALKVALKVGSNRLDTKKLPMGSYTMVHHYRTKNFVKK